MTGPTLGNQQSFNPVYDPTGVTLTGVQAGIQVNPTSGLVTTESGGTATIHRRVGSQPTANVIFGLSSSNPQAGTIVAARPGLHAGRLVHAQRVTVTGVAGGVLATDIPRTRSSPAPAVSDDPTFNGFDPSDVYVTNLDTQTSICRSRTLASPPPTLLSGSNLTIHWDDTNTGNTATNSSWVDRYDCQRDNQPDAGHMQSSL